jgi:3-phenylpropionate/cinnamic acid dioxygenase small subunit
VTTAPRRDLDDILRRLVRLEDERAVLDVLFRYAQAMDHGSDQEWLDLFTDDAVYEVHGGEAASSFLSARGGTVHAKGIRFSGRAELARFIAGRSRVEGRETKHFFTQPIVQLDGDEARVESYYLAAADQAGARDIYSIGRNLDWFVRGADGRWRFRKRVSLPPGAAPYP